MLDPKLAEAQFEEQPEPKPQLLLLPPSAPQSELPLALKTPSCSLLAHTSTFTQLEGQHKLPRDILVLQVVEYPIHSQARIFLRA